MLLTGRATGRGCIAAVIENRAKEVGLACLDLHSMKLTLCQFIEASRSYTGALIMLEQFEPTELVVVASNHQTFAASGEDSVDVCSTTRAIDSSSPDVAASSSTGQLCLCQASLIRPACQWE